MAIQFSSVVSVCMSISIIWFHSEVLSIVSYEQMEKNLTISTYDLFPESSLILLLNFWGIKNEFLEFITPEMFIYLVTAIFTFFQEKDYLLTVKALSPSWQLTTGRRMWHNQRLPVIFTLYCPRVNTYWYLSTEGRAGGVNRNEWI